VKKTQDEPMEGIYDLRVVIWRRNHAKSPTAQLVRQDSVLCGRFFVHRKLKKIAGFISSSNVQNKNIILQIFCVIP